MKNKLIYGDCLDVLPGLEDNSIDSVVTDPPAGIAFMGREWDSHKDLMGFQEFIYRSFSEVIRVLKPGGKLMLHEITRGKANAVLYPVPWASKASISFLDFWDTLASILDQAGFKTGFVSDQSETARLWWKKVKKISETRSSRTDSLGPGIIFGDKAAFFGQNMAANFKNNSICLVEALFKKG